MQSQIATQADAAPLSTLVNAAYRGVGGRSGWTHEVELFAGARAGSSDIGAMIGDDRMTILLRRSGNPPALLGCVAIEIDDRKECTISMLAIDPEHQTGGLGRALLADAESFAAGRGATIAKITVVQHRESLLAWYERRGYVRTGVEDFPYDDGSVGTPLRDDLQFVVLVKAL